MYCATLHPNYCKILVGEAGKNSHYEKQVEHRTLHRGHVFVLTLSSTTALLAELWQLTWYMFQICVPLAK